MSIMLFQRYPEMKRKTSTDHELVSHSIPHRRPKFQTRWNHIVFFATVIGIQMTATLSNTDSNVRKPVDPCNNSLTIFFSYINVGTHRKISKRLHEPYNLFVTSGF